MDIRTLHADGRVVKGGPRQALTAPLTFESARNGQFATGQLDFRSAGIVLDKLAGKIRLERKGFLPVRYQVPHLVLLLLEPGTLTRIFLGSGPSFVVTVTPSGRVSMTPGGKSKVVLAPEKPSVGAPVDVVQALQWEFDGHVDDASQALCDALVRRPAGLRTLGDGLAHPTTAASLDCCHRFLEAVPDARQRLASMAEVSPPWAALVAHWAVLEEQLRLDLPSGDGTRTQARLDALLLQDV
jgi:hypothetical protein